MDFLMIFVIAVLVITWGAFIASYIHDRRKVINGFLFFVALAATFPALLFFVMTFDHYFLTVIAIIPIVFILLFMAFGSIIIVIGSLANARILIQREGAKFSNFLTLLLGIGLIALWFVPFIPFHKVSETFSLFMTSSIYLVALYLAFIFLFFFLSSVLYLLYRPKYNKDYVIVLGSGLIDGYYVPPLLRSRINRAIQFYDEQKKATNRPPILVFSGGQGPDEWISEAEAMQKYALSVGIPEEDTLIENQSTTTYENMLFSKRLIEKHFGSDQYRALFSTNNYHLFRASLYARMTRINAQGIGAKTAWYYVPNAFLREFVAVLMMYRKWNLFALFFILFTTFSFTYVFRWIFLLIDHFS